MVLSQRCLKYSVILCLFSLVLGFMRLVVRPTQSMRYVLQQYSPGSLLRASSASATPSKTSSTSLNLLVATAGDLQKELSAGNLTSVDLVNACLDQIERHDDYLHGIISKAPRASLVEQAQRLDNERKANEIRSTLHGIPILIKVLQSPLHTL